MSANLSVAADSSTGAGLIFKYMHFLHYHWCTGRTSLMQEDRLKVPSLGHATVSRGSKVSNSVLLEWMNLKRWTSSFKF